MMYYFIQHKVHRIPGGMFTLSSREEVFSQIEIVAYTKYSLFEWTLIILDIAFDSVMSMDLRAENLKVRLSICSHVMETNSVPQIIVGVAADDQTQEMYNQLHRLA